jgi:hypothetical protein
VRVHGLSGAANAGWASNSSSVEEPSHAFLLPQIRKQFCRQPSGWRVRQRKHATTAGWIRNEGTHPIERHRRHDGYDHQRYRHAESCPAYKIPLPVELPAFMGQFSEVRGNCRAVGSRRVQDDASTRVGRYAAQHHFLVANVA